MDKERDILREKLRNYAPEPGRDLWSGIEAGIQKKKKRPVWIWMAAAAVIALLMAVWLWPREAVSTLQMEAEKTVTPSEVVIDSVEQNMPLNQPITTTEEPTPPSEETLTQDKQEEANTEPVLPPKRTNKKRVPKVPPLPKPKPKQNLVPKTLLASDSDSNKTSKDKPKPAQYASGQTDEPKPAIVKLSQIRKIETQQGEQMKSTITKPTKVVIIRRAKPKKTQKKKRSFELNIGNTNLLRISRKSNTTEQTTS